MRMICATLFACIVFAGWVLAEEPSKEKAKSSEEIVKKGVMQFYQRVASDDATVRKKELDAVLPDEATLKTLFGDDAQLIWSRFAELRKQIIAHSEKAKEEADSMGKIVSVQVFDLRKEESFGKYDRMLDVIPKDIPIYRAEMQLANGTGDGRFYLVIDGKMRFVRGLDGMVQYIDAQKKGQP